MEMIENEETENEILYKNPENNLQTDTTTEQNTTVSDNQPKDTENQEQDTGTTQENTLAQMDLQNEKLDQIHEDLGVICSFLIIFALVIVFRWIYKFFDMFF